MHRVQHRRNQELLMEQPAARPADFAPDIARAHNAITSALSAGRTWLEMAELDAALDGYGVPLPATGSSPMQKVRPQQLPRSDTP